MANVNNYDKARDLAEGALKKTVEGDDRAAEELAQKAKATDRQAVEDVLDELDGRRVGNIPDDEDEIARVFPLAELVAHGVPLYPDGVAALLR